MPAISAEMFRASVFCLTASSLLAREAPERGRGRALPRNPFPVVGVRPFRHVLRSAAVRRGCGRFTTSLPPEARENRGV